MAFFRSPNCVAEAHHLCLDGAALHCVCPCHRESNQRRREENERKDEEMDRRIMEQRGYVYDEKARRFVPRDHPSFDSFLADCVNDVVNG